jgi:hypothetical protein
MKNKIFAILAAAPAMLVNPSTAAMIATTKKVKAHDNMFASNPFVGSCARFKQRSSYVWCNASIAV